MSSDRQPDEGGSILGRLLRRIPLIRRLAERRWIPDPAARHAHDAIVRDRMRRPSPADPRDEAERLEDAG